MNLNYDFIYNELITSKSKLKFRKGTGENYRD